MRRLVLRGVNVIDAVGAVRRDHAVVMEGDRITRVAPNQDVAGESSDDVYAEGGYVAPGLADMHVHHDDVDEAALFIANGITTVRNMFGAPFHLALRRRYADGSIIGPRLVTTSPIVDGLSPTGSPMWPGSVVLNHARAADEVVRTAVDRGYSQIKAYSFLSIEALRALGRA